MRSAFEMNVHWRCRGDDQRLRSGAATRRDATRGLRRRSNVAGKLPPTAQFMIFNWWCCKELINTTRCAAVCRGFTRPLYCTAGIVVTPYRNVATIASQLLTIAKLTIGLH